MKFLFYLLMLIVLYSCSTTQLDENWDEFYQKFHSDSLFQANRLDDNFVGKGFYGSEIEIITKDNWTFLPKGIYEVDTTKYKTEIEFENNKVKTRIYKENSGINIQSTFRIKQGQWYLIEYLDNFN